MSGVTLHWFESATRGPSLEFLCHVADMGAARDLAREAGTDWLPTKDDKVKTSDPLHNLAIAHDGELLWRATAAEQSRIALPDPNEWQVGAASGLALREQDADSYNAIVEAARDRRRQH
jgi:hypothetical protein